MKEISGRKKTLIIAAHDREHASRDVLSFLKTVQEKYTFTEEKKVKKDVSKKKKKKKKEILQAYHRTAYFWWNFGISIKNQNVIVDKWI